MLLNLFCSDHLNLNQVILFVTVTFTILTIFKILHSVTGRKHYIFFLSKFVNFFKMKYFLYFRIDKIMEAFEIQNIKLCILISFLKNHSEN